MAKLIWNENSFKIVVQKFGNLENNVYLYLMETKYVKISVPSNYSDKLVLIQKALDLYKIVVDCKMTQRDKDMLTLCFLYDVSEPTFSQKVLQSNFGIRSIENVNIMKSRLKVKGFIDTDPKTYKKRLIPALNYLRKAIMENDTIDFNINFQKK